MFERIRGYYNKGLWTAAMVRQAVDKGILSEEQYQQIVGLPDTDSEEEHLQIEEPLAGAGEEGAAEGSEDEMTDGGLPDGELHPQIAESQSDDVEEEETDGGLPTGDQHPQTEEPPSDDNKEVPDNG